MTRNSSNGSRTRARPNVRPIGAILSLLLLVAAACAPGEISGEDALPSGTADPAAVQTATGARAFYKKVVAEIPFWLDPLIVETGVFTDELTDSPLAVFSNSQYTDLDSRSLVLTYGEPHYNRLHHVRAQAREARGFVTTYLPDSTTFLGHLYTLEGYAELFLADLFCSGIPLSTVDYGADYTLVSGSTTAQVYLHAVALFDTALTWLNDAQSADLRHLTNLGRGRALLAADSFLAAATAVAEVPDDYRYEVVFAESNDHRELLHGFAESKNFGGVYDRGLPGVADQEGFNGLNYRSSEDPRVPSTVLGQDDESNDLYYPMKYPPDAPVTFRLADGIEARLIEAEVALRTHPSDGQWLAMLNHLRQTALPDTELPELADPGSDINGTDAPRVSLLFRERAFWLYLTGHRQGDLRRLIRQYQRSPESVYPTGPYAGGGGGYGSEVVFPVPQTEQRLNSRYAGCFHLGA